MKLQDIFDQLASGELVQISLAGQDAGVINTSNYQAVLGHVNLALATLYKRFHLKEGRILVNLQPDVLLYPLTSDYAVSNTRSKQATKYIQDTSVMPFKDDIIKIKRVMTDCNQEMVLNNVSDYWSILTPNLTTMYVPEMVVNTDPLRTPERLRTKNLTVVYQARHPILTIPLGYFDPSRVEIELPFTHLEALLYFVASRINNPIGMTNEFNAGNNYAAKFEAACKELKELNIEVDQGAQHSRHRQRRNGWM